MTQPDDQRTVRIGNALWAAPELLLEYLGVALHYNPGDSDPFTPSQEQWEAFDITDSSSHAYLVGAGETPLAALIDAALTMLGWDREENALALKHEEIHIETVRELRKAITAADKFLRDCNLDEDAS